MVALPHQQARIAGPVLLHADATPAMHCISMKPMSCRNFGLFMMPAGAPAALCRASKTAVHAMAMLWTL
jgi:hypothetical protein